MAITRADFERSLAAHGDIAAGRAFRQLVRFKSSKHRTTKQIRKFFDIAESQRRVSAAAATDLDEPGLQPSTLKRIEKLKAAGSGDLLFETSAQLEATPFGGAAVAEEARVKAKAALQPASKSEANTAFQARQFATQRQRAAQAGASQTIATTPQGLLDTAATAKRKLRSPFFAGGVG